MGSFEDFSYFWTSNQEQAIMCTNAAAYNHRYQNP
jgi:hypothetical protein